jgi:HAE1 family hydrophobic/amphiphilic exporter-1
MNIIDLSIRRRVTIAMFTLAVLLFGSVSLTRLSINLLPDLTFPTLTVRTEYEGAAPAEIENLISKPIEEALGVVKNMVKMESISRTGQSDVVLEFAWGADPGLDPDRPDPDGVIRIVEAAPGPQVEALLVER